MIGRTLSHYKILEEISRGGMGVVYRAVDVKLNREVALKVLPPELVADPERKRRFIQEAQAAASLENPHIAVIYEIDEVEGVTFIVMELIHGKMLRDVLSEKRLPVAKTLELATEVAEGLSRAHSKGIVHRDMKPANVMMTEDGHAKIIDFGLAKLIEPLTGEGSELTTALREETDPGKVMGTVAYMSPEQARGETVDHRSDIFSFGIVLHEMLSGRIPFEGKSGLDTLHAILNDAAPRLSDLGSNASDEARFELQHIVDKCLAKDPSERYQTIEDTLVDLRAARRHLESGSVAPVSTRRSRTFRLVAVTVAIVALSIIGWLALRPETPLQEETPVATSSKPSIAVLFFDNINEDPELDWLRLGLAEMLVTNLSQSTQMDVLPTDRLYRILKDLNSLDKRISSLEVVQEVADRANVETVLVGNFMKAGDHIRINIRIQEAQTGKILTTERVEAIGESNIFARVDDLTRRVRTNFEIPTDEEFRSLEEVTTSSPQAYRFVVEGRKLFRQGKFEEAIALYEKSIGMDPEFAEALRELSAAHYNLGHSVESEAYATRALALGDKLAPYLRYRLEFRLYSLHEEDYARAIEAQKNRLAIDPRATPQNLANRYRYLERYREAIELWEEFNRRGGDPGTVYAYGGLSHNHMVLGEYEQAERVLQEGLLRYPESPVIHRFLGLLDLYRGRLDKALASFDKSINPHLDRWRVLVLRGQWNDAALEAQKASESVDVVRKSRGLCCQAITKLYFGRTQEALSLFQRAGDVFEKQDYRSATSLVAASYVLLETGQLEKAIAEAKQAQRDGAGNIPEWEGLFLEGVAEARLDRKEDADKAAASLLQRTESIPTEKEKRRHHHLMGELALSRDDFLYAIEELEKAKTMLHAHGAGSLTIFAYRYVSPQHVPIWYSLASAYLAAGNDDKAAVWFRRITEAGVDRIVWPIPYVRSFYFLGKIHEDRGDMAKAREYYRRFYEYWKDGDMDREQVEEARSES